NKIRREATMRINVNKHTPTPTIIITLPTNGNENAVQTRYTNKETARQRKQDRIGAIRAHKQDRNPKPNSDPRNHSEDLGHDSWIPRPGEIVAWICTRPFALTVAPDTNVCDAVSGAPQDPFGWGAPQTAEGGPDGYHVYGIALRDENIFRQMFYKF